MKKESTTVQVFKNSFWNFLSIFFSKAGGLIFAAIIARLLLPEKFGLYSLALAVTLFILAITNNATNQALSRYVSEALAKKDKNLASRYYWFIFKIKLVLTLSSVIILFVISYPLSVYIFKKPGLTIPLIISGFYLFVLSFQNFYEILFYNFKKVKYLITKELILQTSKIILIFLFSFLLFKKYLLLGAILSLILSSFIALLFLLSYLKKTASFLFRNSSNLIDKKRVFKFLFYTIPSDILRTVFVNTDIILIGIFLTAEYVGYYSAASTIIGGLFSFILITNLLLPVFTEMSKNRLSDAFNKVCKYTAIISIPIIFGLLILGKYVLRLVYGYDYLQALLPMFFLSIMIFENPVSSALTSLFLAKEKPKLIFKTMLITAIINLVLNIVLITSLLKISMIWAMTGVAIATLTSRLFFLTSISLIARKEFKLSYKLKDILKPAIAGIIMASVLLLINYQIKDMTLLIGIIEIVIGAIIYFIFLILFKGIKKEDYELIKSLKPKFKI